MRKRLWLILVLLLSAPGMVPGEDAEAVRMEGDRPRRGRGGRPWRRREGREWKDFMKEIERGKDELLIFRREAREEQKALGEFMREWQEAPEEGREALSEKIEKSAAKVDRLELLHAERAVEIMKKTLDNTLQRYVDAAVRLERLKTGIEMRDARLRRRLGLPLSEERPHRRGDFMRGHMPPPPPRGPEAPQPPGPPGEGPPA